MISNLCELLISINQVTLETVIFYTFLFLFVLGILKLTIYFQADSMIITLVNSNFI